jgi:hypothetical protein
VVPVVATAAVVAGTAWRIAAVLAAAFLVHWSLMGDKPVR